MSDSSERKVSSRRPIDACSAETDAARSWSSQKPGACISPSSSARRASSAAGSKRVREQLQLAAEAIDAMRHGTS